MGRKEALNTRLRSINQMLFSVVSDQTCSSRLYRSELDNICCLVFHLRRPPPCYILFAKTTVFVSQKWSIHSPRPFLTLSQTSPRDEQFLLFPQVFSIHLENFPSSSTNLKLLSANCFNLEESKNCRLGKSYELSPYK